MLVAMLLLVGVVVSPVMGQTDAGGEASPFATVTAEPESTDEVIIVVPTEGAADLIVEIGEVVRDEAEKQIGGVWNSVLVVLLVVVVTIVLPALFLLFQSAPPWLQKPLAELMKSLADGLQLQYDLLKQRAAETATPIDDVMVGAAGQPFEEVLRRLREMELKLDALSAEQPKG
jgi:hypothetical protein